MSAGVAQQGVEGWTLNANESGTGSLDAGRVGENVSDDYSHDDQGGDARNSCHCCCLSMQLVCQWWHLLG